MAKFTWQDGTLVSKAKVEIGGTIYEVDPEEYSGATPLSASNLNAMQDGIYEDIDDKQLIPTILYSNPSGSSSDITLSETTANYYKIDIETVMEGKCFINTIYNPNGKTSTLTGIYTTAGNFFQVSEEEIAISGTTLTKSSRNYINIYPDGGIIRGTATSVLITKVIGYK